MLPREQGGLVSSDRTGMFFLSLLYILEPV